MINYTEEIIKLATESKWHQIIKVANEALLDTDETTCGFKKGVFNVILHPSLWGDNKNKINGILGNILGNIPELIIYDFTYVKDFNRTIKSGLTLETIQDKYCIVLTEKKGVVDNMLKLNLPYNLYRLDYNVEKLKHENTKQVFEFSEALIRGLIREKQINSLFED